MSSLVSIGRDLTLLRHPIRVGELLRAWDAADEYILSHLTEANFDLARVIIINDSHGALALSLADKGPVLVSDSFVSRRSIVENADLNQVDLGAAIFQSSVDPWLEQPTAVVMKLPKSHQQLQFQLYRLREIMSPSTVLIAAEMTKYLRRSTLDCFESIIGPTKTTLARKKARLIFSDFDSGLAPPGQPEIPSYALTEHDLLLSDHPQIFSAGRLDRGSRLLLKHLPNTSGRVADLGCGNGVLGLALAKRNPSTHISFFDESYMAIETAKRNWVSNGLSLDRADFKVSDCLSMYDSDPFDLIVCNPPFHEGRSIAHHVAWRMFSQSKLHLSQEGRFMVVGNRHLDHHLRLARLFGHCHVTGTDGKFVVLTARVLAKKQG